MSPPMWTLSIPDDIDSVNIIRYIFVMAHQIRNSAAADGYHHGDLRRALIDAALALMTEEQDWTFSLREVARRAGVSHNAPYNHFADKRELLAALAVLGLEAIRARMLDSILGIDAPDAALIRIGMVYVKFGLENPAHYRLMFSSALVTGGAGRPDVVEDAGARTREVLESIIRRAHAPASLPRRWPERANCNPPC